MDNSASGNDYNENIEELNRTLILAKEKALRYEKLFELSAYAMLVIEDGIFVDCNQEAVNMLGYKNKGDLLNTDPSQISPERQPDGSLSKEKADKLLQRCIELGNEHFEWVHIKANGENIPIEVWLTSIKHGDKTLINTIWKNLTDIRSKEDKLKETLKEKELLLKEIHHRIKNNLQIVSSLLNLQAYYIDDEKAKKAFQNTQSRINSTVLIHEMLYQKEDISLINYGEYLEELIPKIINTLKKDNNEINLHLNTSEISLNLNTSVPLGLIINEIITNSIKYGFRGQKDGIISIDLKDLGENNYLLEIGDNGIGLPEKLDTQNSDSLGFQLIHMLTKQLKGTVEMNELKKGTNFIIRFKKI